MIGIGGWNLGSALFSQMVATNSNRQEFTTSTIKFLRDHKFDGIDMCWEYPANRGSPPEDKQKFGELLKVRLESILILQVYNFTLDELHFQMVNVPFMSGDIPAFPIYRVFVSQLTLNFCILSLQITQ